MSCEQKQLLQGQAVQETGTVDGEPWRSHAETCPECREEWTAYAKSLALFRQLEQERVSSYSKAPSWEHFSAVLEQRTPWRFSLRSVRRAVVPVAAGLMLVLGTGSWFLWNGAGVEEFDTAGNRGETVENTAARAAPALPVATAPGPTRALRPRQPRPEHLIVVVPGLTGRRIAEAPGQPPADATGRTTPVLTLDPDLIFTPRRAPLITTPVSNRFYRVDYSRYIIPAR